MTAAAARLGLRPSNGIAPWAILPWRSMRRRNAPLAAWQISPPSGSQQIAAVDRRAAWPRATKSLDARHHPLLVDEGGDDDPAGERPERTTASAANSIAATPDFMSAAPRP